MIKKILGLLTLMILLTGAIAFAYDGEFTVPQCQNKVFTTKDLGIDPSNTITSAESDSTGVKVDNFTYYIVVNADMYENGVVTVTLDNSETREYQFAATSQFKIPENTVLNLHFDLIYYLANNEGVYAESGYYFDEEKQITFLNGDTICEAIPSTNSFDRSIKVKEGTGENMWVPLCKYISETEKDTTTYHYDIEITKTKWINVVDVNVGDEFDKNTFIGVKDVFGNVVPDDVDFLDSADFTFGKNFYDITPLEYDEETETNYYAKTGLYNLVITGDYKSNPFCTTVAVNVVDPVVPISAIIIDGELEAYVGKTSQLEAVIIPDDATDKSVKWSSSDPSIADVDAKGLVTAKKKGNVTISCVSVSNPETGCDVSFRVIQPVEKVVLNTNKLELIKWDKATLKATVLPKNADNKAVEWISMDKNVATVNSKGVVRAVGEGTTKIYCRSVDKNYEYATCEVTVAKVRVKITPRALTLKRGKSGNLTAIVTPNFDYVNQNVRWISSNPKIATVNQRGVVTAMKKGTCKIKAISLYDGKTCDIIKVGVVNK